jgi:hypothetical protein
VHIPPHLQGDGVTGRSMNLPAIDPGRIDEARSTCMPAQVIEPPLCATILRER